jgi:hypothetical protein
MYRAASMSHRHADKPVRTSSRRFHRRRGQLDRAKEPIGEVRVNSRLRTNLYLTTRSEALSKENHLTEFLAAALRDSPNFLRAYAALVLTDFCRARGLSDEIVVVETQIAYPEHGSPDMRLTLADGSRILCEHKLMAEETVTNRPAALQPPDVAPNQWRQLRKYLDITEADGVAFFAEGWKHVEADVLVHRSTSDRRPTIFFGAICIQRFVTPPMSRHL